MRSESAQKDRVENQMVARPVRMKSGQASELHWLLKKREAPAWGLWVGISLGVPEDIDWNDVGGPEEQVEVEDQVKVE